MRINVFKVAKVGDSIRKNSLEAPSFSPQVFLWERLFRCSRVIAERRKRRLVETPSKGNKRWIPSLWWDSGISTRHSSNIWKLSLSWSSSPSTFCSVVFINKESWAFRKFGIFGRCVERRQTWPQRSTVSLVRHQLYQVTRSMKNPLEWSFLDTPHG